MLSQDEFKGNRKSRYLAIGRFTKICSFEDKLFHTNSKKDLIKASN